MKIHKIIPRTRVNGPGLRFGIWVQGCSLQCENCINPETHDPNAGINISIMEILNQIQKELEFIEGVSISGGEPMDQSEELLKLVYSIKEKFGISIILWTGYELKELEHNKIYSEITKYIDVSIIGRYIDNLRTQKGLKGSSNQEYIFHTSCYSYEDLDNVPLVEILFDSKSILITGINPDLVKRWF